MKQMCVSSRAFKCVAALLVALVFVCFIPLDQVASAQTPSVDGAPKDDRPWERLPDGRVVIEIKGVKLAFDADIDRDRQFPSVVFIPDRTPGLGWAQGMNFRQVMDEPARARAAFATWNLVTMHTGNNATARGRFLGRYDRSKVISSMRIELTIWANADGLLCRSYADALAAEECMRINALARNPPALDEDGYIVIEPGSRDSSPEFIYIFPLAERASAIGEAIYFRCKKVLKGCKNTITNAFGYSIRPTVSFFYEFSSYQYPKSRFREIDRRMLEIFDDILVTTQ
jgi:hypothetical protein